MVIFPMNEPQLQTGYNEQDQQNGMLPRTVTPNNEPDGDEEGEPEAKGGIEAANPQEVLEALEKAFEDKNLAVKLENITKAKIRSILGKASLKRFTPKEIISEAINSIIEGDRKWYKSKVPDIVEFIYMVVASKIRNEAAANINFDDPLYNEIEAGTEPKKRRFKPKFGPLEYKTESSRLNTNSVADVETAKHNYNIYTDDADAIKFDDYIERVEMRLNDDEIAFFVFMERLNGVKAPAEIASKIGVDVQEVYNALKRVKRVLLEVTSNT